MYKHTVTYTDFNGDERKEDLLFHLSVLEVTRFEAKYGASIEDYASSLSVNSDANKLIEFLEDLILTAHGKKSPDGRTFIKNPALREEFSNSIAYAQLFEEILKNPDLAKRMGEGIAERPQKKAANTVAPTVVSSLPNSL